MGRTIFVWTEYLSRNAYTQHNRTKPNTTNLLINIWKNQRLNEQNVRFVEFTVNVLLKVDKLLKSLCCQVTFLLGLDIYWFRTNFPLLCRNPQSSYERERLFVVKKQIVWINEIHYYEFALLAGFETFSYYKVSVLNELKSKSFFGHNTRQEFSVPEIIIIMVINQDYNTYVV